MYIIIHNIHMNSSNFQFKYNKVNLNQQNKIIFKFC